MTAVPGRDHLDLVRHRKVAVHRERNDRIVLSCQDNCRNRDPMKLSTRTCIFVVLTRSGVTPTWCGKPIVPMYQSRGQRIDLIVVQIFDSFSPHRQLRLKPPHEVRLIDPISSLTKVPGCMHQIDRRRHSYRGINMTWSCFFPPAQRFQNYIATDRKSDEANL